MRKAFSKSRINSHKIGFEIELEIELKIAAAKFWQPQLARCQ